MLVPQEKLLAIKAVLEDKYSSHPAEIIENTKRHEENALANDPWQGSLGDKE